MSKKLSALEFERMERARLLKELRSKEGESLKLQSELINAQKRILELQISNLELKRRDVIEHQAKVNQKIADDKKQYEDVLTGIKKRLKLKGKFGYNPDSLEVVEDEPSEKS